MRTSGEPRLLRNDHQGYGAYHPKLIWSLGDSAQHQKRAPRQGILRVLPEVRSHVTLRVDLPPVRSVGEPPPVLLLETCEKRAGEAVEPVTCGLGFRSPLNLGVTQDCLKNLKYSATLFGTEVHFAKARMLDRQGDTVSNRTALYTLFPDNQAHARIHAVPRGSYQVHTPLRSGSSINPLMCRVCELLCPYHRQLRMHVRAQTA